MKKIALLASAAMLATAPAFAGSLSAGTEEADPYVAPVPEGSGVSPLLIGLGVAGIIGAVILLADSNSSSGGTTTQP